MARTLRVANQTNIGSNRAAVANPGLLFIDSPDSSASGIVFISQDGTETVIWARNNGHMYYGTRANFATPESAGTALA